MMLSPDIVERAVDGVSSSGRFFYTRANLFYELLRQRGDDIVDAAPARAAFEASLSDWEDAHGRLPGLIRPEAIPREAPLEDIPADLLEYAVPRVLLFDHLESLLVFAQNGFHRKIEVGLALLGFPTHVHYLLSEQLAGGFETTFYAVHDATPDGYEHGRTLAGKLGDGPATCIDLGLTLPWAFRLRLPIRTGAPARVAQEIDERHRILLEHGKYVELAELPPVRAMNWVYDRIADQAEEVGFG